MIYEINFLLDIQSTSTMRIIAGHSVRCDSFDGVFSSDRLPPNPRMLVSNTHPSDMPGEHWVVIYISDNGDYGEFFDSFGSPPTIDFNNYMNNHCSKWTYNRNQLQSIASNFCGLFVHVTVYLEVET